METIDFLAQSTQHTRKSIRDIDDSYNNDWDILSELCQNSVDAIRKLKPKKGIIKVTINSQNKEIVIEDNGCGIDPDMLPNLMAPFSTNKDDDEDSVGEKGVGLTFVIFSTNSFYIKSGNSKGCSEGKVLDALNWKFSSNADRLKLSQNLLDEKYQGTFIKCSKVKDLQLFQLSFKQLMFLLRTKTAIGNTNSIWGDDVDIDITLEHINQDGETKTGKVNFEYWLPIEGIEKSALDINDYNQFIKADRTDAEKRRKLNGKIIYKKGTYEHKGRIIKFWACFMPERKYWKTITIKNGLATEAQYENPEFLEDLSYVTFKHGIYTSVKGMPTGISTEHPTTGALGAWPQIFILFEDRQIKFDIGRKALHGSQARIFKEYSKDIFREFQRISKYMSADPSDISSPQWDKEETFAQIEKILDLNYKFIKHQKSPKDQEASVVGLFYECIGNGIVTDILPLSAGYKRKYDLYAKWGNKKVVIEFKARLRYALDDFSDEKKLFDEINCIVCWDVTEEDIQAYKNRTISVEKIEKNGLLDNEYDLFPSATHRMIYSMVNPIYIIDLKTLLENKFNESK